MTTTPADSAPRKRAKPTWRDVSSGFVTGLFSIPEGMAYASIGGFAAPMGLWSGVVPTIIGSMLARTVLMVTTLTSAIAITSNSVLKSAGLDPGDIGAIATMTVLAGIVMLTMGLLRLGSVMAFVSTAVMTGFTTGIAVQIVAGVVSDATGYAPISGNTVGKLIEAGWHVGDWDGMTIALTLATVAVWFVVRFVRVLKPLATLVALLVVSVLAYILTLDVELVSDIAPIPRSLPPVTIPDVSVIPALATGAFAIALVALAQAAGIGAAVANPDGSKPDASKDFSAQGAANIAGGFFGALPTGGSLSRTGVATSAGASTRWSGIFAGVWLAVIVLAVGPMAGNIPMAVIGGLMLVIGAELVIGRWPDIRLVLRTSKASSAAMIVTFAATTALPLQQAIFIGAGLSILLTAIKGSRAANLIEVVKHQDGGWHIAKPPATLPSDRTTVLHYFGVGFFSEFSRLDAEWPDASHTTNAALVISARGSLEIPSATFLKLLDRKAAELRAQGLVLVLCGVPPELHNLLKRTGELSSLGRDNIFPSTDEVMGSIESAYAHAELLRVQRKDQQS